MKNKLHAWLLLVSVSASAATVSTARTPSVWRTADLKSFFHGEPEQPPKAPPPKTTATVATADGVTPDKQIEDFFRAFADAVKAREGDRMLPRLSDKYTIADLPEGHKAPDFFVQAVDRTPGPEAIIIQSVEPKGPVRVAKVEIHYPDKVKVKTFQFDAEGRLLASDLFMLKRVEHGM